MGEKNGYATRDALLGQPLKRRFTDVEVCGQKFRIRSLNNKESSELEAAVYRDDGRGIDPAKIPMQAARWIVACVVDAEGNQIFSDADLGAIRGLDGVMISDLADACQSHNSEMESAKN